MVPSDTGGELPPHHLGLLSIHATSRVCYALEMSTHIEGKKCENAAVCTEPGKCLNLPALIHNFYIHPTAQKKGGKMEKKKKELLFGFPRFKFLNQIIVNDVIHNLFSKAFLGKCVDDAKIGLRGDWVS